MSEDTDEQIVKAQEDLRLCQRHGYHIAKARSMVASDYLPAGEVLLITRTLVSK